MALSKSGSAVSLANTTNSAGGTTNSTSFLINYGGSTIVTIANGGTPPTLAGNVTFQVSADNSTFFSTDDVRTAGLGTSTTYTFKFDHGVGGVNGGDWAYGRYQFSGNTGQSVTITANQSSTSSV